MEYKYTFVFATVISVIAGTLFVFLINPKKFQILLKKKSFDMLFPVLSAIAALLTVIVAVKPFDNNSSLFKSRTDILEEQIEKLDERNTLYSKKMESYESILNNISFHKNDSNSTDLSTKNELSLINQKQLKLEEKVSQFEGLLLTEAENLITLPLLKKDIENINKDISLVKQQIVVQSSLFEESQSQGRWLIGTLGLGLLALIVPLFKNSFFSKKQNENKTE